MKQIVILLLLAIVGCSYGCADLKKENKVQTVEEEPKYYVVKEDVDLLISPSASSKKLVNEKASSITKDMMYCELDKSCKLVVLENKGKYTRVKVIEPDWLTNTYIGWVPTDMLAEFGSIPSAKAVPSKITAFNNINALMTALSQNGIGELHSWRSDDLGGFMSITDYYRFGMPSPVNGLNNNLAYYLESSNETYVEKLTLVLNIFNAAERKDALIKFNTVTKKTFGSLKIAAPPGLIKSVSAPKAYSQDNKILSVKLEREKNNIETWKLTIESK